MLVAWAAAPAAHAGVDYRIEVQAPESIASPLREGIGLRAYGQRNPLVEYKRESYALFEEMWEHIEDHVVKFLYHAEPVDDLDRRHAPARKIPRCAGFSVTAGRSPAPRPVLADPEYRQYRERIGPQRVHSGGVENPVH